MNRKSFLRTLAGTMLVVGQAQALDCTELSTWQADAAYLGGDQVQHRGHAYEANWWTQNQNPKQHSGQYQEWSLLGTCDGSAPNQPPQGAILSPQSGEILAENDSVIISVSASDGDGQVVSVEFLVDGASIGTDSAAPWQTSWAAAAGSHSLSARIQDDGGLIATTAAVEIQATYDESPPPQVTLSSPTDGSGFVTGDLVPLAATASDPDDKVTRVQFFVDGQMVNEDQDRAFQLWLECRSGQSPSLCPRLRQRRPFH